MYKMSVFKKSIITPFEGYIIGIAGSGKSNLLINLIANLGGKFKKIYIYSRNEKPTYHYLQSQIPDDDMLQISYDLNDLQKDFNLNDENKYYGETLVVFDDIYDEKFINDLFIKGRKMGVSSLYLTQSYTQLPTEVLLKSQYIFIMKTVSRELRLMLKDYGLAITSNQLQNMYNYCSDKFSNCLLVDLNAPHPCQTFRKNFIEFLNPMDFI